MLSPDIAAQTLANGDPVQWTFTQEPGYPSHVGGLYIHTQHRRHSNPCELPSPAPTAPVTSPPDWSKHYASSVSGPWALTTPTSPVVGENGGGGLNQWDTRLLYAAGTTTPPTFGAGLQGWTIGTNYMDISHSYPAVPAVPHGASVPGSFAGAPWAGHMPAPSLPSESFLEPAFSHAIPPHSSTANIPHPLPNPPPTKPPRHSRKRTNPKSPKPTSTPAPAATTYRLPAPALTSSPTTTTNSDNTSNNNTPTAGPTLRTAARRFKRPAPGPKPGESPEHRRARTNHNMVEQQYRHRLHARFEALLEVLPEGIMLDDKDGEGHCGDPFHVGAGEGNGDGMLAGGEVMVGGSGKGGKKGARRMSKVDVLSRAARVIRYLESDYEKVRREVEVLRREREAVMFAGRGDAEGISI